MLAKEQDISGFEEPSETELNTVSGSGYYYPYYPFTIHPGLPSIFTTPYPYFLYPNRTGA